MAPLLEIKDLCLDYGAVRALNSVSLKVEENEIVTVLGANGAGKTSLLKAISGLIRPSKGSIQFRGEDLSRIQAFSLAGRGIAHVPRGQEGFLHLERPGKPYTGKVRCSGFEKKSRPGQPGGTGVCPLSDSKGKAKSTCRYSLGRGAADACHWPGSCFFPIAFAFRRTFIGARPNHRPGNFQSYHKKYIRKRKSQSSWWSRTRERP